MRAVDWFIVVFVASWAVAALVYLVRSKKKGKSCLSCSGCDACPHKKGEENCSFCPKKTSGNNLHE